MRDVHRCIWSGGRKEILSTVINLHVPLRPKQKEEEACTTRKMCKRNKKRQGRQLDKEATLFLLMVNDFQYYKSRCNEQKDKFFYFYIIYFCIHSQSILMWHTDCYLTPELARPVGWVLPSQAREGKLLILYYVNYYVDQWSWTFQ